MTDPPRQTDEALHEQQEGLLVTPSSIGDGVIATDTNGGGTFLNPVAESLTGWTQEDAAGKSLDTVFKITKEASRHTVESPATRDLRDGVAVGLANPRCSSPMTAQSGPLTTARAAARHFWPWSLLSAGTSKYDEPGVFVSFEETDDELKKNVRSLGFDLDDLIVRKKLAMNYVRVERSEIEETGEYDLEGLFVRLQHAIDSVKAERIVLDTIESLISGAIKRDL